MGGDPYDKNKKSPIKKRDFKTEIQRLQAEKHRLDLKIKNLKKQLSGPEDMKALKKKYRRAKIVFKINSHNDLSDTRIFSQLLLDLDQLSRENGVRLEYKIKKGSLIVTLAMHFAFSVADHVFSHFIMRTIRKLRETRHIEITKIDNVTKEKIVRSHHEELNRSFKGIIEITSVNVNERTGTQYVIRDNNDVDWRYNVFDNGDFRSLP